MTFCYFIVGQYDQFLNILVRFFIEAFLDASLKISNVSKNAQCALFYQIISTVTHLRWPTLTPYITDVICFLKSFLMRPRIQFIINQPVCFHQGLSVKKMRNNRIFDIPIWKTDRLLLLAIFIELVYIQVFADFLL